MHSSDQLAKFLVLCFQLIVYFASCSTSLFDCFITLLYQIRLPPMRSTQEFFINNQKQSSSMNSKSGFTIFTKKFMSTRQFISAVQFDSQSTGKLQLQNQSYFYRSQLKAALHLVVSLIKICGQKQLQIKNLSQEVAFLRQKMLSLQSQKSNKIYGSLKDNQNYSGQLNIIKNTPNKKYSQDFQAQKMLNSGKFTLETSEYKKLIAQKEESLKINKEENFYLRQKLLSMTLKITESQRAILELKKINVNLQKDNHYLSTKLQQNQYIKALNFSPISKISKISQQGAEDEISFNQLTFAEKQDELIILKQQIQQFQTLIQKLTIDNKDLHCKLQTFTRKNYVQLENNYNQIKKQLNAKIEQVQKYRQLQTELSQIQKHSLKYLQENKCLKAYIKQIHAKTIYTCQQINDIISCQDKCKGCILFKEKIEKLDLELSQTQEKYLKLKGKIQKLIQIEQNKRKQVDQIYDDLAKNKLF